MCSVSRVEIHISKFWLQTAAVFHNQHLLCLQLFHCSHPCFLTQNQKFALFWGVRNESYFNSSYLSTCELSCCEEHELSSEQWWKHLPVWVVYMRKSWDEIQRLYVGRSLKIVFCGGEGADDHPSPSCVFTLQPPSFCSQWRNLSGVLTPIFLLSTLNQVGLVYCEGLGAWLCLLPFHEWQSTYCQRPDERLWGGKNN